MWPCLLSPPHFSFTPHHHKSRQKVAATHFDSFIQENIERKLKTIKVSKLPHSALF